MDIYNEYIFNVFLRNRKNTMFHVLTIFFLHILKPFLSLVPTTYYVDIALFERFPLIFDISVLNGEFLSTDTTVQ